MTDYEELVLQLLGHCYLYYELDDPVLTDAQYDRLYRKLQQMEQEIPESAVFSGSPTHRVGFDAQALKDFLQTRGLK